MHRLLLVVLFVIAAGAVPTRAELLVWEGSFDLRSGDPLPPPHAPPPYFVTGTGVATINASSGGATLRTLAVPLANAFGHPTFVTLHNGANEPSVVLHEWSVASGTLSGFPRGSGTNQLPIRGWLFAPGLAAANESLTRSGTRGFGLGGASLPGRPNFVCSHHCPPYVTSQFHIISLQGAPWTVGSATLRSGSLNGTLFTRAATGLLHGPLSFTSTAALAGGELQMVTPLQVHSRTYVRAAVPSPYDVRTAYGFFARITIRFIPEPDLAILLGAGGLATAVLARRSSG